MMKKLIWIIPLLAITCCTASTEEEQQTDGIRVTLTPDISRTVVEGTTIDLVDYITVDGGEGPYTYSTALQDEFVPSLERLIPTYDNSPQMFGVWVRDSRGVISAKPFAVAITIAKQTPPGSDVPPAFPGAEGGGMYTTGGREGTVYYVTNLLDAYPNPPQGSLRWALNQSGPKIVMFKVSGVIELVNKLHIRNDGGYAGRGKDITVAGESAPGDGICLKNYPLVISYADNVIIRFLRFRTGDKYQTEDDAIESRLSSNVIIDHCSASWSVDEVASFYAVRNFTLQWSILTESLRMSFHSKGTPHGYGGIWGGKNSSFHHNLISRNDSRNPRLDAAGSYTADRPATEWRGYVDMRNNLIYGWGTEVTYGGEGGFFNMVGNYYKEGPKTAVRNRFFKANYATEDDDVEGTVVSTTYPTMYMSGNRYESKTTPPPAAVNGINTNNYVGILWYGESQAAPRTPTPQREFPILGLYGNEHTTTHSAIEAHDLVIAGAGAWPRDKVDNRAATDALNRTTTYPAGGTTPTDATFAKGLIDSPTDVGGYPTYQQTDAPLDTDGDGMPDAWETEKGLDPANASDGRQYTLDEHYTNLEIYLHKLAADLISNKKTNTY